MAYNPPRGSDVTIFVYASMLPPAGDDVLLHVNDTPLNQPDVTATLGPLVSLSEAVRFQTFDVTATLEELFGESDITLAPAIGDAKFSHLFSEVTVWQPITLNVSAEFAPLRSESTTSITQGVTSDAIWQELYSEVDFCIDALCTLLPTRADSTLSITGQVAGDAVFSPARAYSDCAISEGLDVSAVIQSLWAESFAALLSEDNAVFDDVLAFAPRDTFVTPDTAPADLNNILHFTR